MKRVVLIGGTGAGRLVAGDAARRPAPGTPYGAPSGPLRAWHIADTEILFLPRHGAGGTIPPHLVNYRANIWAARELEPDAVIGINAVGGITSAAQPTRPVIPHQLIDYTWGREHTFSDNTAAPVRHVEFDPPFSEPVRAALLAAAAAANIDAMNAAVYGVTQGPRLETAAEIERLAGDRCDVVGMTAMPEASLARELDLAYAICAVVVNRAAGRLAANSSIHGEVDLFLEQGMAKLQRLIETWVQATAGRR
jgi:purine nucleoside phosphorylase